MSALDKLYIHDKNKLPKYCSDCGKEHIVVKRYEDSRKFNKDTGNKISGYYYYYWECPDFNTLFVNECGHNYQHGRSWWIGKEKE